MVSQPPSSSGSSDSESGSSDSEGGSANRGGSSASSSSRQSPLARMIPFTPPSVERMIKVEMLINAPIDGIALIDGLSKGLPSMDELRFFGVTLRSKPYAVSDGVGLIVRPNDQFNFIATTSQDSLFFRV